MGQNIAINALNTAINSSHFAHVNGKSDRSTFECAIVVNGTIFRCNGLETGELTRSILRTKVERSWVDILSVSRLLSRYEVRIEQPRP